jgi:cupin fold WbuC family metalloprotein
MTDVTVISKSLLASLAQEAIATPRKRKNYNFHATDQDACHRLLNALEPETYIVPHRHLHSSKAESLIILRGKLGLLIFDTNGKISQHCVVQAGGDVLGADIPPATYHSVVALSPGTVFFEAKAGPYVPLANNERAAWAPAENSEKAVDYLLWMKQVFSL